jgi:hypothetical protein
MRDQTEEGPGKEPLTCGFVVEVRGQYWNSPHEQEHESRTLIDAAGKCLAMLGELSELAS